MRHHLRVKRLARKLGAKPTRDGNGVIATLEIARRLITENPEVTPEEALLQAADKYASPNDPVKAFWTAHYAWASQHPRGLSDIGTFEEAIKAQGQVNQLVNKGPK